MMHFTCKCVVALSYLAVKCEMDCFVVTFYRIAHSHHYIIGIYFVLLLAAKVIAVPIATIAATSSRLLKNAEFGCG